MNILCLLAHGKPDVPDLGPLVRRVERPEGDTQTAILGKSAPRGTFGYKIYVKGAWQKNYAIPTN